MSKKPNLIRRLLSKRSSKVVLCSLAMVMSFSLGVLLDPWLRTKYWCMVLDTSSSKARQWKATMQLMQSWRGQRALRSRINSPDPAVRSFSIWGTGQVRSPFEMLMLVRRRIPRNRTQDLLEAMESVDYTIDHHNVLWELKDMLWEHEENPYPPEVMERVHVLLEKLGVDVEQHKELLREKFGVEFKDDQARGPEFEDG